jgi:hypothetical protein
LLWGFSLRQEPALGEVVQSLRLDHLPLLRHFVRFRCLGPRPLLSNVIRLFICNWPFGRIN